MNTENCDRHFKKRYLLAVLLLLLSSCLFVGLAYAYTSSVTTDAEIDVDFYDIKIKNGSGVADYALVIDPEQKIVFDSVVTSSGVLYSVNTEESAQFTFTVVLGKHDSHSTVFHITGVEISLYKDNTLQQEVTGISVLSSVDVANNRITASFTGSDISPSELQDTFLMCLTIRTEYGAADP